MCKLDGSAYSSCSSPKSYTSLFNGSHTFYVRATDYAGNTGPTPAGYTWKIDTVAPDTTIDSKPSDPSNNLNPSFSFSSTSDASFECQLDWSEYGECTSPQNYAGLVDGSHTFQVRAIDQAGNTDPWPASWTWEIDTVAPDTTIDTFPNNPSNSSNAAFTFSSSVAGAPSECQMDGAGFISCTSPKDYTGVSDSLHTFQVRAIEPAGNVDSTPASHTWTIEEIAITRHGKAAGVLIGFESEDDWFEYRLENHPACLQRVSEARVSFQAGHGIRLEDLPH